MIKVLICDDSAMMRRTLKKIIEADPDLTVIGTARNGDDAVAKARDLRPDVVTMDINMPGIDGITAMQYIVDEKIAPVLMVSSLTQEGAEATFEALALGAFDFVGKPGGTVTMDMSSVASELTGKIKAACGKGTKARLARKTGSAGKTGFTRKRRSVRKKTAETGTRSSSFINRKRTSVKRASGIKKGIGSAKSRAIGFKAVAIGISTGGPKTIFEVLPCLPADLNAAVFLVQHMPPAFTGSFAKRIDNNCAMRCVEVEAGMIVEPGVIYLARGGMHLCVRRNISGKVIIRTPKRPVTQFIPGVNVMMESVLSIFGEDTIGVEMTGMGDDGADSMVKIKENGGVTIAESEETAIVFGMPREAIERGGADIIVPSYDIADEIIKAAA